MLPPLFVSRAHAVHITGHREQSTPCVFGTMENGQIAMRLEIPARKTLTVADVSLLPSSHPHLSLPLSLHLTWRPEGFVSSAV